MPCYEDRGRSQDATSSSLSIALSRITYLEAALCAILTELSKYDIWETVLLDASKNGEIDIQSFWKEHVGDDVTRLIRDLQKYSAHELDNIYRILGTWQETKTETKETK